MATEFETTDEMAMWLVKGLEIMPNRLSPLAVYEDPAEVMEWAKSILNAARTEDPLLEEVRRLRSLVDYLDKRVKATGVGVDYAKNLPAPLVSVHATALAMNKEEPDGG